MFYFSLRQWQVRCCHKQATFICWWLRNFSVRQNKQDIEKLLTEDLSCLSQWLIDNKFSLHLGKIESILFGSTQKIKCNPSLEITCNNSAIKSTTSVKYLGASLDQTLSFSKLAQSLLKKANARLKCLYRNSSTLLNTLNTFSYVVNSMSLRLCLRIWYKGLYKVLKNKLQTTQNKLIRFVLDLERRHISKEHFELLNW